MNSRAGIEIRLARFLREIARRPFRMGQQDCGLMLADWRLAEIGIDPAREIRGHYNSTDEAAPARRFLATDGVRQAVPRRRDLAHHASALWRMRLVATGQNGTN
jgi:hypothetical protein